MNVMQSDAGAMKFEVEFLPVGEGCRAGDAILVRYGEELMIVDGGDQAAGEKMVEHVRTYHGDVDAISHVVLTHADQDHASGLRAIVAELDVRNLWMHLPWESAGRTRPYFKDKRWTDEGLARVLREKFDIVSEIAEIAARRRIAVRQPFAQEMIGPFTVLSPFQPIYDWLLPQIDRCPEADREAIAPSGFWLAGARRSLDAGNTASKSEATENWETERLREGGVTSASNECSVVLYGDMGGQRRILLTGDAGRCALTSAAACATALGMPLAQFAVVQIPHHGSRSNVGPSILNRLVGPVQPRGTAPHFTAFVSAPKDDSVHPRKMVTNAFIRRGAKVIATRGAAKRYHDGFGARPGYAKAEPMSLALAVEDYD